MALTQEAAGENMAALAENPYPGRGIVIGRAAGEIASTVHVYWVMGRSENSRNRQLVQDGDTVKTQAFDPSKVKDPSLIIYNAFATVLDGEGRVNHVVSNGDQTDTVVDGLGSGISFEGSLIERTYEPDAPNFTPRITGLSIPEPGFARHALSMISRRPNGEPRRQTGWFDDADMEPGVGACIHTYASDSPSPEAPIPSFTGEPRTVLLDADPETTADRYWEILNRANRVALVVKQISLIDQTVQYAIRNQLQH